MNRKLLYVVLALVAVLAAFLLIVWIGGLINSNLKLDQTALLRFVFVGIGLLIVFGVYYFTREHSMWEVGTTRQARSRSKSLSTACGPPSATTRPCPTSSTRLA